MSRIVLIGAGSVEFTRNVLADILGFPELRGTVTVVLHDIDAERLGVAERVARSLNEQTKAGAGVEAHRDRRAALDGADYVINEIQVGGFEATRKDFDIPRRFGVRQTIADTIGIGGIFRGLRTIPVMLGIGRDMAELCPHALLLNYTNPMAMLPWAVYEGTPFTNVVGLCHSVRDTHAHLADLVGIPVEEIAFTTAGFNHQAFVLRFEHRGEDLYPRLRDLVEGDRNLQRRARVEIFRRFGYFPTESSEHSSEYVPWFLRHDDQVQEFRIPIDEYLRRSQENLDELARLTTGLDRGEPLDATPTSELASEIVHAMETGLPRDVYANVRNGDLIENLPPECCVEVPAVAERGGVRPTRIGRLPAQLAALNRTFLNVAELTVRAGLEQRRDLVYQAALLDPNTAATLTTAAIVAMCDELIDAHGDLLPEGIRRG